MEYKKNYNTSIISGDISIGKFPRDTSNLVYYYYWNSKIQKHHTFLL